MVSVSEISEEVKSSFDEANIGLTLQRNNSLNLRKYFALIYKT